MTSSHGANTELSIEPARECDLKAIVQLIAEDEHGFHADSPETYDATRYGQAFAEIDTDPRNELFVARDNGIIVGTVQITFIPYIFDGGSERALVETMFVARDWRGRGVGGVLLDHACARARERGCGMVQLNSNKQRADAHRFYVRHGFEATHEGFKRTL
jgi:GNAT superfamily N-acetyltransferase